MVDNALYSSDSSILIAGKADQAKLQARSRMCGYPEAADESVLGMFLRPEYEAYGAIPQPGIGFGTFKMHYRYSCRLWIR